MASMFAADECPGQTRPLSKTSWQCLEVIDVDIKPPLHHPRGRIE